MKYVFVVNPMAGNDNQRRIFSRIKSAFRQVDDEMIIEETHGPGDAKYIASRYAEKYGKKIITSSDAHYLWDINERGAYIELDCGRENAAQALINYLRGAV